MGRLNLTADEVNNLFPVVSVSFYSHGLVINRCFKGETYSVVRRLKRGRVTRISRRSLNRMAFLVANCEVKFYSLATLTYGANYPLNGRIVKMHINKFVTYMRRSFGEFEYFWFLEFQQRGAPHFHFVSTLPGPSRSGRELLAVIWAGITELGNWPYTGISSPYGESRAVQGLFTRDSVFRQHRRVQVWEALRSQDGAARYAVKYALKSYQKSIPTDYRDLGRSWAASRGVRLPEGDLVPATEEEVREVLYQFGRNMEGFQVLPKIVFCKNSLTSTKC